MPYRRWKPAPPPETPSLWERVGGLPGATAAGIRGITGILAPGYIPGAAIAGGGEAIAQVVESLGGIGLDQSIPQRLARIGTEAATGAIPFAKVLKSGQALRNFARAGGVAVAGDVARQMTEKGEFLGPTELDYKRLGTVGTIGGTAGATSQKVIDYLAPGSKFASKVPPKVAEAGEDVVEQTARPGGQVLVPKGKPNKRGEYGSYEREDVGPNWRVERPAEGRPYGGTRTLDRTGNQSAPRPVASHVQTPAQAAKAARPKRIDLAEEFFKRLAVETGEDVPKAVEAAVTGAPAVEKMPWEDVSGWANVPSSGRRVPIRSESGITPREQKVLDREARDVRQAENDAIRNRKEAERIEEARVAKERAESAKARGLVPEDSVVERAARVNEEGAKETTTRRWVTPPEESLDDLGEEALAETLGSSPAGRAYAEGRARGLSHEASWARAKKYETKAPTDPTSEAGEFNVADLLKRSGDEAAQAATEVAAEPTGLARIFRKPEARTPQPTPQELPVIDADFTVEGQKALPPSPLGGLLTGKVKKPRAPKAPGTQVPDMGPNWPPTADVIEQSAPRVVDELADLEEAAVRKAQSSYDPNWPPREDVLRQSSTYFDDEIDDLTRATDAAGDAYRQAKLGGDPEMARARGAELSALARQLGLPVGKPKAPAAATAVAPEPPKLVEPVPTPPVAPTALDDEIETLSQALAAATPGTRAEARLKGKLFDLLKKTGLVSGEAPKADFSQPPGGATRIQTEGPGPAGVVGPARPELPPENFTTEGDWVTEALREAEDISRAGPEDKFRRMFFGTPEPRVPGAPEVPPVPPIEPLPPPPTPAPRGPKPKTGPKGPALAGARATEPAPVSGLQSEADRLLRNLAGAEEGSKPAQNIVKALKTLAPRVESAKIQAQRAAQAELEAAEQALAKVTPGSPEEVALMEQAAAALKKSQNLGEPPKVEGPTILSKGEGKPKLVKKALKDPLGNVQGLATDMLPLSVLTTIIGGLTGAALNPDDPYTAAALGAGLGFAGPQLPLAMSRLNMPKIGEAVNEVVQGGIDKAGEFASETIEKIPNAMRANLLWSGNLPINAALAPYGSAAIGGLEQALQGNPAGMATLRNLNPIQFGRDMWSNVDEAAELIAKGEMGRLDSDQLLNPSRSAADLYMSGPAVAMAAGDVTGRNAMKAGGMTEEMARKYAVTGEPNPEAGIGGFVGHTLANIGRGPATSAGSKIGKAAIGVAQPFRRTLANVVSEGVERIPGLGVGVHLANKGLKGIDWNEVAAQQKIAIPLTALSGLLGAEVDPETAKLLRLRAILSNMSGVYSLPASLAYTIGLGLNEGQAPKQLVKAGMSEALPLPSTAAFEDAIKAGIDLYSGETPKIPRQMYPGLVRDIRDWTGASETVPKRPRRIPRMNRKRNSER